MIEASGKEASIRLAVWMGAVMFRHTLSIARVLQNCGVRFLPLIAHLPQVSHWSRTEVEVE